RLSRDLRRASLLAVNCQPSTVNETRGFCLNSQTAASVSTTLRHSPDIHAHRILILAFGAQYTQLIARRVRESGVYCEIHPWDISNEDVRAFGARGVILSGGPESVADETPPLAPSAVFELGVPVLGICYGMQVMAQQLGGKVA